MPQLSINGVELYYEEQGAGPETIVFAHGLLLSSRTFERQIDALKSRFRCIALDFRTHGRSERTRVGLDMDTLADDVVKLIEAVGAAPCHLVGLSMGGFVGLRLAILRPELLRSLILLDSSAEPEPHPWPYRAMALIARWLSPKLVLGPLFGMIFGPVFLNDPARAEEREFWRRQILDNDMPSMARAISGVLTREALVDQLDRITVPTLIVVGEDDVVTPLHNAERLHEGIAGSKLVVLPGSGHITPVEVPDAVTEAIESFLGCAR